LYVKVWREKILYSFCPIKTYGASTLVYTLIISKKNIQ